MEQASTFVPLDLPWRNATAGMASLSVDRRGCARLGVSWIQAPFKKLQHCSLQDNNIAYLHGSQSWRSCHIHRSESLTSKVHRRHVSGTGRSRGGRPSANVAKAQLVGQASGLSDFLSPDCNIQSKEPPVIVPAERNAFNLQSAAEEALQMLEWQRICQTVATFASTSSGQQQAGLLNLPDTQEESERLLQETAAALALDASASGDCLDFGRIDTKVAEYGLYKARKSVPMTGEKGYSVCCIRI
jgi:hypothetical protein